MANDAVAIEAKEKNILIPNEWKVTLDYQPKVPRRKRTRVEYSDCNCKCNKKLNFDAPETAAMANGADPGAKMANSYDPGAEFPAAMMNCDDPGAKMPNIDDPGPTPARAMVNGGVPGAAMANDDDPGPAPAAAMMNGSDPGAAIANGDDPTAATAAMVNGGDPGAAMSNGDDPGAAVVNGGDPGAEIGNDNNPGAEVPPPAAAVENGGDPEMPAAMREHIIGIGGYNVQHIIKKVLTATDLRTDQGRLSLPPKKLRGEFLTAEEEKFLVRRAGDGDGDVDMGLNYIDTTILGPDLTESGIRFKKWRIGAKYANCLMNKWNSFAKSHSLKAGNTVRLWSFRVDRVHPQNNIINSELCFALDKI